MSFYGCHFSFNGIDCREYGLMMYDFDNKAQKDGNFSSAVEIIEDRIPRKYAPIYYGSTQNTPLEFSLVFGVDMEAAYTGKSLDRYDLEVIGSWLTGIDGYRWLEIEQSDMSNFRYKCIITDLKFMTVGSYPQALECRVRCDSPFAYTYPKRFSFNIPKEETVKIYSRSTYNGKYYPDKMTLMPGNPSVPIVMESYNTEDFVLRQTHTSPSESTANWAIWSLEIPNTSNRNPVDAFARPAGSSENYSFLSSGAPGVNYWIDEYTISDPVGGAWRTYGYIAWFDRADSGNIRLNFRASLIAYYLPEHIFLESDSYNVLNFAFFSALGIQGFEAGILRRDIIISNLTAGGKAFSFEDIPASVTEIYIDNERGIITCDNGLNIYTCFENSFTFFSLVRGDNYIKITGNCEVYIDCEFPVNIGG